MHNTRPLSRAFLPFLSFLPFPLVWGACVPTLPDDSPLVTTPRVLAVKIEPAEAEEGAPVRLTALAADSGGPLEDVPISWSFCTSPRPLAELGPVAESCLDPRSLDLAAIGSGTLVEATLPDASCSLFGPNPPLPEGDEPPGRPADPDGTGGFYQPVLGFWPEEGAQTTLAAVRLRCGLANVAQETYIAWNLGYRSNENPQIERLEILRDGEAQEVFAEDPPIAVAPGEAIGLRLSWPSCPLGDTCGDGTCAIEEDASACPEDCTDVSGCGGAETYLRYDLESSTFERQREAFSAFWFTTGGAFEEARNGRAGEDTASELENTWTAPSSVGDAWIWVVLRDERGGLTFSEVRLIVEDRR